MATTYKIRYAVNIAGEEYQKDSTFISGSDNIPEAMRRFKTQLPTEQRKTFVLIDVYVKHTSGLRLTMDEAYGRIGHGRG